MTLQMNLLFLDFDVPKSLADLLLIFTSVLFMPENVGTGNYALVDFRVKVLLDVDLLFIDDIEAASCPELSNSLSLPCPSTAIHFLPVGGLCLT